MKCSRCVARSISGILIVAIAVLGISVGAQAGMVGTDTVLAGQQSAADRDAVLAALDRAEVRRQLVAYGVDPEAARDRVAALSDQELQQMADGLEQLPAGGLGSVIGAAVFIFVVLLVTDILGYTDVFPFVKKTVN